MKISINQPAYLPWLGYYERIAASDLHVVLDHVQFEKNSFINRNRIKTKNGPIWLTIPVLTSGRFQSLPIDQVIVDNRSDWKRKHWESINQAYGKSPYFFMCEAFLKEFYAAEWDLLLEYCMHSNKYILNLLSIKTPLILSSELGITSKKTNLVLDICKKLGATTYYSGALGKNYLDKDAFQANGIEVVYQDYPHPVYKQMGVPFVSHLSTLDLMCNHGPESLGIINGAS